MYDLNPDNKPLALGCRTRAVHYPARIDDRNPSDFLKVFSASHSSGTSCDFIVDTPLSMDFTGHPRAIPLPECSS